MIGSKVQGIMANSKNVYYFNGEYFLRKPTKVSEQNIRKAKPNGLKMAEREINYEQYKNNYYLTFSTT